MTLIEILKIIHKEREKIHIYRISDPNIKWRMGKKIMEKLYESMAHITNHYMGISMSIEELLAADWEYEYIEDKQCKT